jgi:hypothetical protein
MTVVNGLRLASRGFLTGLAAGYVWLATAVLLGALQGDMLAAVRPVMELISHAAGANLLALALGIGLVLLGAASIGMVFAYFFGRFFTVRTTLLLATPCFALLAWALLAGALGAATGRPSYGLAIAPVTATLIYGVLLGAALPVRGDVLRAPGGGASSSVGA